MAVGYSLKNVSKNAVASFTVSASTLASASCAFGSYLFLRLSLRIVILWISCWLVAFVLQDNIVSLDIPVYISPSTPTVISRQTTDFAINPFTRVVIDKHKSKIYLSAKEFDLLYFLYSHRGQVFSKEQLYENVWGYDDMPASSNLTSFIRKLRKKVEPDPNNPQYIITVWGVGYKFSEEKP